MKRITILFIILFLSFNSQAQNETQKIDETKKEITRVVVTLTADSKGTIKENILDSDIIKRLSESEKLIELRVGNSKLQNSLHAVFYFRDVNSYYKWYDNEDTKNLLNKIKADFINYKFDLKLNKANK